jgi:uncharacterized protein (TIGR02266 family)
MSGVSGMHPRMRPAAEDVEVPSAVNGGRDVSDRLAEVTAELAAVRLERDDLEARLLAAFEELGELRATVSSATTEVPPSFLVPAEDDVVLLEPDVSPPAHAVVVASPDVATVPVPRPVPAPRPGASHGTAELSRLVVSPEAVGSPASHPDGAERRQHERLACGFDVEFLGDSHFITGIAEDLSEGGIFVATYHSLPIGTPVTIGFEHSGGRRVEIRGEVRWVRREREDAESRPGVGIAFTDLAPEALACIAEFLGALPARYYEF